MPNIHMQIILPLPAVSRQMKVLVIGFMILVSLQVQQENLFINTLKVKTLLMYSL